MAHLESFKELLLPLSIPLQVILTIILVLCSTRSITSRRYSKRSSNTLPYWLPYFGHFFQIVLNWQGFLRSHRADNQDGMLVLHVLGRQCTIILDSELAKVVLGGEKSHLAADSLRWRLLRNVFGAATKDKAQYFREAHHSSSIDLSSITTPLTNPKVTDIILQRLPEIVSFASGPIDQNPWERSADPVPTSQLCGLRPRPAVSVSLVSLLRNFVGHAYVTSILGAEFMEMYPSITDDLSHLDEGWQCLALGLPRWLPVRSVTNAYFARRRLLSALSGMHAALDAETVGKAVGESWSHICDVSEEFKRRSAERRERKFSVQVRAVEDIASLWSLCARISSLTAWMILHIWNTPGQWSRVREEILPFAQITPGVQILRLSEPDQLSLDLVGLKESCPLVSTCVAECTHLYHMTIRLAEVKTAFRVSNNTSTARRQAQTRALTIEDGTFIGSVASLSQYSFMPLKCSKGFTTRSISDPVMFDETQGATRLQDTPEIEMAITAAVSTVAGFIAFWDMTPVGHAMLKLPKAKTRSPFVKHATDLKVMIAQRNRH